MHTACRVRDSFVSHPFIRQSARRAPPPSRAREMRITPPRHAHASHEYANARAHTHTSLERLPTPRHERVAQHPARLFRRERVANLDDVDVLHIVVDVVVVCDVAVVATLARCGGVGGTHVRRRRRRPRRPRRRAVSSASACASSAASAPRPREGCAECPNMVNYIEG